MRVVLGCGNFGGIGSAPAFFGQGETKEQAFALMDAAWELGLDWFDTADAYGGGRSEPWIGDWMRATGNRPRITTKTFNPMEDGADSGLAPRARAAPARDEPRAARRRPRRPLPRARARPGRRRSPRRSARSRRCSSAARSAPGASATSARPTCARGSSSARRRSSRTRTRCSTAATRRSVIPLCAEHGIAYQAFSPLAGGWLTGKYRRGEAPPEGSRMTMRPEPYRTSRADASTTRSRRSSARPRSAASARPGSRSPGRSAGRDSVVVGPRRPEHLEPVREALALELSPAERDEVGSLFPMLILVLAQTRSSSSSTWRAASPRWRRRSSRSRAASSTCRSGRSCGRRARRTCSG